MTTRGVWHASAHRLGLRNAIWGFFFLCCWGGFFFRSVKFDDTGLFTSSALSRSSRSLLSG